MQALYPKEAEEAGVEGSVRIQCIARENGRLDDCEILAEEPPGWGFGEASIRLVVQYVQVVAVADDGTSTAGTRHLVPVLWRFPQSGGRSSKSAFTDRRDGHPANS